jgi:hypothetical protein
MGYGFCSGLGVPPFMKRWEKESNPVKAKTEFGSFEGFSTIFRPGTIDPADDSIRAIR